MRSLLLIFLFYGLSVSATQSQRLVENDSINEIKYDQREDLEPLDFEEETLEEYKEQEEFNYVEEEKAENINIQKKLTKIYIPPSNFWVHPFIGTANRTPNFVRQETEVEQIVEVKLEDFLNESSLIQETLSTSYAKNVDVPAFFLNGHVVWGATAMMLSEVKMILKSTL